MKIYLEPIGCRLNQSEMERLGNQFIANGHTLVEDPAEADLVVVNTCAVTGEAAADSRQAVRRASRAGKAAVAVTGCWATLEPQQALALPGVQMVISNTEKEDLARRALGLAETDFIREPLKRIPLPGEHLRTRAFIKAQDGCDHYCTYCITRIARGRSYSRPAEEVIHDIRAALESGVKEIVLSGVQLGSWGLDFSPRAKLKDLMTAILSEVDAPRLRLSSLEPWGLDDDFFELWNDPRLCRHLHLPLQSGSGAVLRRMRRNCTPESYLELINRARAVSPEMAITTDLMVGFPGESEKEFEETLNFVRQAELAGGHVFNFSARPDTPAARYPEQVPPDVRKGRSKILRLLVQEMEMEYRQAFVGRTATVLWEAAARPINGGWMVEGLTDNYIHVEAESTRKLWNEFGMVRLESVNERGMSGILLGSGAI